MPLFEYQCKKCGHTFEELVPRADAPAPACPKCGAENAQRQLSTFSASVAPSGGSSCSGGSCSTGSCPTGTCPFA
jgi:putative FmdB family regulatory protein